MAAGALAVRDRLHERVAAEPVRAVHGDAGDLSGRVQRLDLGAAPDVRVDAAHVVVGTGPDGNGLVDRVDPGERHRELAGSVEPLEDLLRAEVAQVEEDVAVDAAAVVDLGLLGARDDVARRELHRVRRIADEEPLAVLVQEVGALPAAALGDEHTRRRERRRVELHHLHVLQRHARAERERHAVAGAGVRVRRPRVQPPRPARREDHGLRADHVQAAVHEIPGDDALAAAVLDHELPGEELLVRLDIALHHLLVEHVDEDVARDVGCVRGARLARGAEGALRDPSVGRPREDRAPVLELVDVARRLVAEDLDRVLVAEVVRALDRVVRVLHGIVLGRVPERGVDPAFGRAGVAADRVDLGDHRHVRSGVESLDRGAHSGAAGADDDHVVDGVHRVGRYLMNPRGTARTVAPRPARERAGRRHVGAT